MYEPGSYNTYAIKGLNVALKWIKQIEIKNIFNHKKYLSNLLIEEINELPFEFNINSELEINDLLKVFNLKIDTTWYTTIVEKIEFIIIV